MFSMTNGCLASRTWFFRSTDQLFSYMAVFGISIRDARMRRCHQRGQISGKANSKAMWTVIRREFASSSAWAGEFWLFGNASFQKNNLARQLKAVGTGFWPVMINKNTPSLTTGGVLTSEPKSSNPNYIRRSAPHTRSKRSAFMTFTQAATKSLTNFSWLSSWA